MATLPTYRRQVLGTGVRPSGGASSNVSAASPIGQALQGFSQDLNRVAGVAGQDVVYQAREEQERVENEAAINTANTLSEGRVYWQQNFQERSNTWKPGDPDLREGINKDFDAWAAESEAKLPTEKSKLYFKQHATALKTSLLTSAYDHQQKTTTAVLDANTAIGVQADENVVYGDPSLIDTVYQTRAETIRARTDIGEPQKIKLLDQLGKKLSLSAERGALERDPAGWMTARFGAPEQQRAAAPGGKLDQSDSYNVVYGYGQYAKPPKPLTSMTLGEAEEFGNQQIQATKGQINEGDKGTSALGAYQIINGTRAKYAEKLFGKDWRSVQFTAENQDKLGRAIFEDSKDGNLQQVWTSLPNATPGAYANKSWDEMKRIIKSGESSPRGPLLASANGADAGPLTMPEGGWGKRPDGSEKGNGFLGPLRRPDGGVMTEYSVGVEINGKEMDIPTLVPTLSKEQVNHILNMKEGDRMPPEIIDKAVAFAEKRVKEGKPVFAQPGESPAGDAGQQRGTAGNPLSTAPKTFSALDWEQQSALVQMANTKISQGDARYKAGIVSQVRDAQAMHRDGIVDPVPLTEAQFFRAFGEEGSRLYAEYQNSRVMGADIGRFKSLPAGDIAAVVQAATPQPGAGYAAADERQRLTQQAAQQVIQQRKADPAGYVTANTPELAGMAARINDPATPAADKPALTQKFVTDSLAEQTRLGIAEPRILTPGQAASIGQVASSATRPEDAANLIGALENQYGKHFPRVFNELVAGKQLANEMLIIPNLQTPAARETVSRLARVKETDLTQSIDAKDQKSVKDLVTQSLEPVAATISLQSDQSSATMNAYEITLRKMAYAQMAGGASPSEAVERSRTLLLGQYTFAGTMRLPKVVDESAAKQGTQARLYDSLDNIDVPRDLISGARTPDEQRAEWLRTVRARPLWFTNDDDGGVSLWATGENGVRYRVTQGGAPVSFTWAELQMPTRTPQAVPQDMGRPAIGTGEFLRRSARQNRQ